jgi:Flp pilus assembly protein TadG
MILLVSILELTMFIYTYATLSDAAKEGVRYAVVHGSSGTGSVQADNCGSAITTGVPATVLTYASLSLHKLSSGNVSVDCPNGNTPGNAVQVSISYPYRPLFGLNWATVTVSATSAGSIAF